MPKMTKTEELVLSTLKNAGRPLTLAEITEKTGEPSKKVFKALRKFFEKNMIDCVNRQYKLVNPTS